MTTTALADVNITTYDPPIQYERYPINGYDYNPSNDREKIIHDLRNMVEEAEATSLHEFSMSEIINSAEQQLKQ